MIYYELWIIMWKWKKEFSVKEFISTFQTPNPNKTLFDMVKKGFLEKVKRGQYRVISPEQLFKNRINVSRYYNFLKEVTLKYSLTSQDAVFLWTKGGYQIDRFFGFYPIYIKVLKSDLKKWKQLLKSNGMRYYVRGNKLKETFFGTFYMLVPKEKFTNKKVNELYVDSLSETIKFCRKNIYQYEPALEMLNDMYDLKIDVRYREI